LIGIAGNSPWVGGLGVVAREAPSPSSLRASTLVRSSRSKPASCGRGAAKIRLFDVRLPGFIAERRVGGTTFYFRYRDMRGRSREVKLGRFGDVTVEEARGQAEKLRASVRLGADPVAERAKRRAVPLLADFARDRYLPHVAERLRSSSNNEVHLRLRILPALGRKALDEITHEDVAALRRRLIDEGLSNSTVNRHLATLRSMFNYALRWRVFDGRNPAAAPGELREVARDRYLSGEETRALVAALGRSPCQDAAAALALLIVTGARKSEVRLATWDLVDLDRGMLSVVRSKNDRPRHIPLSPVAVAILRRQAGRRADGNPHVFPSRTRPGMPLADLRWTWQWAKRAAGLSDDFRIHDARHSFASALANAGIPLYEIGAVLGHRQLATTTRYAHHAPARLVETASTAARAWNLLPSLGDGAEQP
jgi:integrase